MHQIDNTYATLVLIEILLENGLINRATYDNILKSQNNRSRKIHRMWLEK